MKPTNKGQDNSSIILLMEQMENMIKNEKKNQIATEERRGSVC